MRQKLRYRVSLIIAIVLTIALLGGVTLVGCTQQPATTTPTQEPAEPTASQTPTPTLETTPTTKTPDAATGDTVKAILDAPTEGQTVTLTGTISRVLSDGEYMLDDGTGQIKLDKAEGFPRQDQGAKVVVTGTVDPGDNGVEIKITKITAQ